MADNAYVAVRIEGGLLPSSVLSRLSLAGDGGLPGLTGADYGLAAGESVREAANRVWAYLRTAWAGYRSALEALPASDRATSLTRDRWLHIVLDQLGYGRVPQTPAGGLVVDGKSFAVSHHWGEVPIHLLGARIDLDRRSTGVAGAAGQAPQSMVQELLNRSDDHLWAILSNGSTLRLLRDSTSLVGSAYVEFDLEAIFEGELFSDFVVLYTLVHSSRLAVRDPEVGPGSCWLETWREVAVEAGSRALDQLREGVVSAIEALGTGFLAHPANVELRERVERGELSLSDLNHGLLRVVYRLLFTFVAEDRGVLLDPAAEPLARQRYHDYFSTARLREVARRRRGGRHGDRWRALSLVWGALGRPEGQAELGLVGIGGLYDAGELDVFDDCELSNEALLSAVRSLSLVTERGSGVTRVVDYRALDSEELGSIYEALLEYVPRWDVAERTYRLGSAAGNTRKTTGSYYTPTSLIDTLLDSALDPVIADAVDRASSPEAAESALLALTVCDPACGSGHFLVAAARRIAKAVAAVRTGDPEPPPETVRTAVRDVVGRCIYGVDINPLAAELAKVSLWLEAMEPGRPLTFLDAHVRVGNALVGATPGLLAQPLPQEAFKPIIGDAKPIASATARRNKAEAAGQDDLFGESGVQLSNADLAAAAAAIGGPALSLADAHVQAQRLRQYETSPEYRLARRQADAWCAAFVWRMLDDAPECPTTAIVRSIGEGGGAPEVLAEVDRLAAEYRFFHWHLEFPDVFPTERPGDGGSLNEQTGWYGGFDVVLGNPPWERVKLQEQEFFASRDPEIAGAPNAAARKRLIKALIDERPALHEEFLAAKRRAEGESHVLRTSGRYPLAGRGDINTYAVFTEGNRSLVAARGRMGIIVPTGIATDATTQHFFRDVVQTRSLASIYDFENSRPLFSGVHRSFKFCLLTIAGREASIPSADFAFFAHHPSDLARDGVRFTLTPEEINLLNPNTGTCPVFRTRRDAEITLGIYRRVPVLINENDPVNGNPWGITFMTMFHMSNDSHLFHTREELEADGWTLNGNVFEREIPDEGGVTLEQMLPLYEAKMIHHYDTKWATYEPDGSTRLVTAAEKRDPSFHPMPRYWVHENDFRAASPEEAPGLGWVGFRNIARATDARTWIGAMIPRVPVGHSMPIMTSRRPRSLQAVLTSLVVDYTLRQKLGGTNLTYNYMQQLPVIAVGGWYRRVEDLVDRLNAQSLDTDVARDFRAEIDAVMFHVYGVSREDTTYVLDTFPIVKAKDEAEFGEYLTKRLILEHYDRLAGEGVTA